MNPTDEVPSYVDRTVSADEEAPADLRLADAAHEQARALWAIAAILDELREEVIDGP